MATSKIIPSKKNIFKITLGDGDATILNAAWLMSKRRHIIACFGTNQSRASFAWTVTSGQADNSSLQAQWVDGRTDTITAEISGNDVIVTTNAFGTAWANGFAIGME
jgi:hypothetical protein